MRNIQQYLNENQPKNRTKIFIEGNKIGEVEGNTLIIEDYNELESIYIADLPKLTKLTIKDCAGLESLELHSDKKIEVELKGEVSKLKNIKSVSTQTPTIIYQQKQKNFCWNCVIHTLSLIGLSVLAVYITYLSLTIRELKALIKRLKNNQS